MGKFKIKISISLCYLTYELTLVGLNCNKI